MFQINRVVARLALALPSVSSFVKPCFVTVMAMAPPVSSTVRRTKFTPVAPSSTTETEDDKPPASTAAHRDKYNVGCCTELCVDKTESQRPPATGCTH